MSTATRRILLVNGPNLNLLGSREPAIYGTDTLDVIVARVDDETRRSGHELRHVQANSEGEIINWLQAEYRQAHGLIINPAGLAHTSVALRDTIAAIALPAIEVHISNVYAREPFRQVMITATACIGTVTGLGSDGYLYALRALLKRIEAR